MGNNSTNINKMNSYLSLQFIDHIKDQKHMPIEIQILARDMQNNIAGVIFVLIVKGTYLYSHPFLEYLFIACFIEYSRFPVDMISLEE